jgi:hypothetical protein
MKKRINVKPLTELELVFEDGKNLELVYDVKALLHFNELANEFLKDPTIPEICAKIVYIGGADRNESFDLEEARKVVACLDPETITIIINAFNETMGAGKNEVQKDLQKKLMEMFLLSKK